MMVDTGPTRERRVNESVRFEMRERVPTCLSILVLIYITWTLPHLSLKSVA